MRRSTVVMLIVLVLIAGLYWYTQQPDNVIERAFNAEPTATVYTPEYLVDPLLGAINRISINRADGKSLVLDNSSGFWVIASEGDVAADQASAGTALTQVQALRIVTKLENAPAASATGLAQPAYTVLLETAQGVSTSFKVGVKTATGSGYYVEKSDGKVVIVDMFGIEGLVALVDTPPYLSTPTPEIPEVTPTP